VISKLILFSTTPYAHPVLHWGISECFFLFIHFYFHDFISYQTNSTTTNPVAMATKFKTKSLITRPVEDISPSCLRLPGEGGFSGTGDFVLNFVAMATGLVVVEFV